MSVNTKHHDVDVVGDISDSEDDCAPIHNNNKGSAALEMLAGRDPLESVNIVTPHKTKRRRMEKRQRPAVGSIIDSIPANNSHNSYRELQAQVDLDMFSVCRKPDCSSNQYTFLEHNTVDGLSVCRNFLTESEHSLLLNEIDNQLIHFPGSSYGTEGGTAINQAMRFGLSNFPILVKKLAERVGTMLRKYSPLFDRTPVFNQLIANEYQPGEGIKAHVDLVDRFEDGIVSVSFNSPAIMIFRREIVVDCAGDCSDDTCTPNEVRVLLLPGDLLCMERDARWIWTHDIPFVQADDFGDTKIQRSRRVSITLRKLT